MSHIKYIIGFIVLFSNNLSSNNYTIHKIYDDKIFCRTMQTMLPGLQAVWNICKEHAVFKWILKQQRGFDTF